MPAVGDLGIPALLLAFGGAAVATWIAGVFLSRTADALDERLGLGEALGGMIVLAIAGSLPEVAITVAAAASGNVDIAAGNLVGGIAIQTVVLVLCDATVRGDRPLSHLVGSLLPVLEAALVVVVVAIVLAGSLLPASVAIAGVSPASIAIVVAWIGGILVLDRARRTPRWKVTMEGSAPGRHHRRVAHPTVPHPYAGAAAARVVLVFLAACLVTLVAGVVLAQAGSALADAAGVNGVVFGATILAAATALPEVSTGIEAVRLGDHQLAMGDIFGGNAFQVCLFLVADLVAGRPVLPAAGPANAWLAALGIALTTVYAAAVIVRPDRRTARLGPDSILVVGLFLIGILGLATIAEG